MSEDGGAGPPGGVPGGTPPTCYRHPERETYVTCARCGRPICPDCMVSASVGFQCPECVREANKSVRAPRTTFGGPIPQGPQGIVTNILIAINVIVFVAVQGQNDLLDRMVLRAYNFGEGGPGVVDGGWYRLLTAAFLHQQSLHIFFNMLVLWMFGRPLEAQLGRARYLGLYLICALGGSTASYLFNDPAVRSLGASGAVIGLIGALLVVERRLQHNTQGVLIYLAILLVPGLLVQGIDWRAHIGGLITGGILGAAIAYAPPARRTAVQAATAVGVVLVLMALVAMRTHDLNNQLGSGAFGF